MKRLNCVFTTSLVWITLILGIYSFAISNQMLVIPQQAAYMKVTNETSATPTAFDVKPMQTLDDAFIAASN